MFQEARAPEQIDGSGSPQVVREQPVAFGSRCKGRNSAHVCASEELLWPSVLLIWPSVNLARLDQFHLSQQGCGTQGASTSAYFAKPDPV